MITSRIDWQNPKSPWYATPSNHRLLPGEGARRYHFVKDRIAHFSKVLDVGCNCGQLAKNLTYDLECEVWGIDIVPEFIEHCKAMREAPDIRGQFVLGDFSRMTKQELAASGLPEGYFDVVTALDVIEHPIDVEGFKRNLQRVLRVGGNFLLTTPHPLNPGAQEMLNHPWHARLWDRVALEEWLGELLDYDVLPEPDGTPSHIGAMWQWDGTGQEFDWNQEVDPMEDLRQYIRDTERRMTT